MTIAPYSFLINSLMSQYLLQWKLAIHRTALFKNSTDNIHEIN